MFTVVQWAALAWVTQDVFTRRAQSSWPALDLLFAGGLFAARGGMKRSEIPGRGPPTDRPRHSATSHGRAAALGTAARLQSIGGLAHRRDELARAAADLNATTMAIVRRAFISGSVMDVVITFSIAANATYVGLSLLGYVRLGAAPTMTLFGGLFALLLCPKYFQPLRAMAAAYHAQERALSAVPTIIALLTEAQALPQIAQRFAPPPAGPVAVVLDNITFRFPNSNQPVLHGVNVTVRPLAALCEPSSSPRSGPGPRWRRWALPTNSRSARCGVLPPLRIDSIMR